MWLGLFALTKAYFLFVNLGKGALFLPNFIQVWRVGTLLDLSMVGYLSVVPILGILLGKIIPRLTQKVLLIYGWFTWLFLVLVMEFQVQILILRPNIVLSRLSKYYLDVS